MKELLWGRVRREERITFMRPRCGYALRHDMDTDTEIHLNWKNIRHESFKLLTNILSTNTKMDLIYLSNI